MSVPHPYIRFTYEDYSSLPESMEKRYELLDGELKMVPAPTTTHQFIVRNLEFILHAFVRERVLGTILAAPVDVVFGEGDAREVAQPDIIYIGRERAHIITEAEIQGAPDLVAEVLSPGTEIRDRGYKRHLYGRYGVREYWIVDPETETVEVCRLVGAAFEVVHRYGAEDTLYCELFPGLAISLRDVFWVR
jgi:Uma2 family endonuclease